MIKPLITLLVLSLTLAGCVLEPGGGYGNRGYGDRGYSDRGWGDRGWGNRDRDHDHAVSQDQGGHQGNWSR